MRDLTERERYVLAMLAYTWNEFLSLPSVHVMEKQEFIDAIHRAQCIIMARPAADTLRDNPLMIDPNKDMLKDMLKD